MEGEKDEPGAFAADAILGEVEDVQDPDVDVAVAALEAERPSARDRVQDRLVGEMGLARRTPPPPASKDRSAATGSATSC